MPGPAKASQTPTGLSPDALAILQTSAEALLTITRIIQGSTIAVPA